MTLKGFKDWIIYSSNNSDKLSLTIRGVLVGLIPVVGYVFHGFDFSPVIENIITFVKALLSLVSISMVVYGGIRKLWTTYKGTNAVVNS